MTTGCYETSLLLFENARGAGALLTVKCPSPETHREENVRGLPGERGCLRLELTCTLFYIVLFYVWAKMFLLVSCSYALVEVGVVAVV